MFPTLEVRWFYQGRIPEDIRKWFARSDPAPTCEPARTDYYLCLPKSNDLGIKLREGRIEIKQRVHQYGSVQFHRQATGLIEHWHKWSLPLAMTQTGLEEILVPESSWTGVRKERLLRGYRCDGDGQVIAIPVTDIGQGCHMELANIQAGDRVCWTVAFEAYGDEPSLRGSLASTIGYIFERDGVPCQLDAKDSFGYARWLALLEQGAWHR